MSLSYSCCLVAYGKIFNEIDSLHSLLHVFPVGLAAEADALVLTAQRCIRG